MRSIHEVFLAVFFFFVLVFFFFECEDFSDESLPNSILTTLDERRRDVANSRGQGYDRPADTTGNCEELKRACVR